jgi:MFS family permease
VELRASVRRQVDLLRGAAGFRLLFASTIVSGLGTWLSVVALTIDVFDRTGSGVWVAALLIADFLPAVAIGLALGPLVDRLSRKKLLVGADVVRCAVFALLPFTSAAWQIVALAGVAGVATGFARPALWAGLPNLVVAEDLPQANSVLRTVDSLTQMAGTFAGGLVVAVSSPDVAYVANSISFAISAVLLAGIPGRLLQSGAAPSSGHWQDVAEGIAVVRHSRPLLTILVSWNLVMLAAAFVNVSEVVLAKVSYSSGDLGFGLMWAATGAGSAAGALLAAGWLESRSTAPVYAAATALMALGYAAAAAAPTVWIAIWCVLVTGVGNATAIVCNSLLVQRGAPDHLRGRAFTLIMGSNFAVLGIGMAIAGPVTDAVGARWVWAAAAFLAALGAAVGYAMLRGERDPGPAREPATAAQH